MMDRASDVVIVGAGHAGAQTALMLRQLEFRGTITLIGEEPEYPYERPPLSKEYLAGEKEFERLLIRPEAFWSDRGINVQRSCRVIGVDPKAHAVTMEEGPALRYETLVWATGGSPRRLTCSGHDLQNVHTVRSRADVDAIRSSLGSVQAAAVIGGGYIGLEAAAVLTKLGKRVCLLEAQDRILSRVAGADLSRFYEAEHRARGVDLRTGVSVDCIIESAGRASGVRLRDGDIIPADMVIVGVGITPATAPLTEAGAAGRNGVDVDERCRTSLPDVFAIGDCASHCNRYAGGRRLRVESVQNATDQASIVARNIAGESAEYDAVPWFWSHQYDLRLQTVGLSVGHDQAVLRGDPASRKFSVVYLREGQVIALDCINTTKDYVQGRKLVVSGIRAEPRALSNVGTPLNEFLDGPELQRPARRPDQ